MTRELTVVSRGHLARIEGFRGEVMMVSSRSLTLLGTDGTLLVVHDAAHGHTPTSLLVDGARPGSWGLAPGDAAAGRLGRLLVGPVLLDGRGVPVWSPVPARLVVVSAAAHAGAVRSAAGEAATRLGPLADHLAAALTAQSLDLVGAALTALVGFGPGLTPSGDDVIVGLLAVLYRLGGGRARARALALVQAQLPALLDRTTVVSAHHLRLALAGHFSEPLTNFVDACADPAGPGSDLVAAVLATGATSGADGLVGVATGLGLLGAGLVTASAA